MDSIAESLWQEFAVETEEHLQAAEQILAGPDPERIAVPDIAQLFRSFHSIKGLARAMDLSGMEGVAHHAENLLGLVRDGRATLRPPLADLLLQSVDALKRMRDGASERRQDAPPAPEMIARLAAAFAEAGGDSDDAPASPAVSAPAAPPGPPSDAPLHHDPEMLAIFVEMIEARAPELCAALADDDSTRETARDAAGTLAHAASVMSFEGLAASLAGLRDKLQLRRPAALDKAARQELLTHLGDIRLQIELLGETTGRDAGTAAFTAALAGLLRGEPHRLALALSDLNRNLRDNLIHADELAVQADAAEITRLARTLGTIASVLSFGRTAAVLLLVEDLYARIASGEVAASDSLADAADEVIALIARQAEADPHDLEEAAAAALVSRLRGLTASSAQRSMEEGSPLVAGLRIPSELLAILSDENLADLERGISRDGLLPYEILAHLETAPEQAARFLGWLKGEARAITNRTVLRDGESWFEFLVLSRLDPSALVAALRDLDPERRCLKRVRRLTSTATGEILLDGSAEGGAGGAPGGAARAGVSASPMRVRGELIDALLDEIGEFRAAAASLRHLVRGGGSRVVGDRTRTFAARLPHDLRSDFLVLVRDARDRDRRLLEAEEVISGMLSRLHQNALELRVVPIDAVLNRLIRLVHDLAQRQGKSVELVLEGRDVRVDKGIVDALADPLIHMVRNAIDHGIETPEERHAAGKPERAQLTVRASQRGSEIDIEVADDGSGLDAEAIRAKAVTQRLLSPAQAAGMADEQIYQLIFEAGLSTATAVTETSGRGVGMDVVLTTVRRLNGDVAVRSEPGRGTAFTLALPISAALQTALIVRAGSQSLGIPERHVISVAEIETDAIRLIGGHRAILHRQAVLPLYGLADLLGLSDGAPVAVRPVEPIVIASNGRHMIGLEVDAIEQRQELYLKELDPRVASFPGVGGASVLGDGRVVLVLDADELIQIAARGVAPAAGATATIAG